jgi:nickel/cobalt exporter
MFGAPPTGGAFGTGPNAMPPETNPILRFLLTQQAELHRALSASMRGLREGSIGLFPVIAAAFAYGVIHAIGPGHGKAVIVTYLVANEASLRRGVALAFGAAGVQAIGAFALVIGLAGLLGATAGAIEAGASLLERAGFLLITAMGLWLFLRKLGAIFAAPAPRGGAAACSGCGLHHGMAATGKSGRGAFILAALGAGARPCTGAILLLVFGLSFGLYLEGALGVAAMAIGTAIGTSLIALIAVKAKKFSLRYAENRGSAGRIAILSLEALAGLLLALLGAALLFGALAGGA